MAAVINVIFEQNLTSFYTLFEFLFFIAGTALANGFKRTRHIKGVEDED